MTKPHRGDVVLVLLACSIMYRNNCAVTSAHIGSVRKSLVDALFRDADIIFVDPEKYQLSRKYRNVQKGDEKIVEMADIETVNGQPPVLGEMEKELEHPFFAYFRARIHRPVLRIIAHHIIDHDSQEAHVQIHRLSSQCHGAHI